ncbi:retrovirus-related pol polyprotein from transposon TNT 1-94 [Tanacetum coccineum]
MLISKKKALNIKLPLLEHLNRTALSKDGTVLWLRLLVRCFQLLSFHYHFGLKQLQPHAILRTDQSSYRLIERRHGENLDKMKEKGDPCVMVGYSTQSKGYRVYNKRTRLIVESIHIKFDEIKEMMSDHNSSDLAPQRQEMSVENVSSGLVPQGQKASDYDNSDPVPPRQNVVPTAKKNITIQHTVKLRKTTIIKHRMHHFKKLNLSILFHDYRWTRDHPLEQVRGNPTMPVQTRRQLATDPEMCMFALTVSIVEPKNIKEAMVDSAWIEAMHEELHQFDRLKVWELVDKPFGKMIIKPKWLGKNKKDEDQTVIRNKARLLAKGYAQEEGID